MKAIVTSPPYSTFLEEVVAHPSVSGIRLNTVMRRKESESIEDLLRRLKDKVGDKDLWVDLKCRQLRVVGYWEPPYTEIQISHKIKVNTPVEAYFRGGDERHRILEIDGCRLIMEDGPRRVVGPGESINIVDPSLEIEGYFTETDKKYIEAGKKVGVNKYMLSFVEGKEDVEEFKKLYSDAEVVAKIESRKGMNYVKNQWNNESRLMAARGDLYLELKKPHYIVNAVENIVEKDSNAIVASRILDSFANSLEPSCSDIGDLDNLMRMGYKNFMFGDEICLKRESIISGLNLFKALAEKYEGKNDYR